MNVKNYHIYVTDLLKVCGIENGGKEQPLWDALYHLCMAAALRDLMTMDEKELLKPFIKKLQFFFSTRFDLRERKGKQKKESFPPNPLIKKKQEKTQEERTCMCVDDNFSGVSSGSSDAFGRRKDAFRKECLALIGKYGAQQVGDFYHYWAEETKDGGKMRWETKKTWNTEFRMARWAKNEYTSKNDSANIRLEKVRQQQAKEAQQQQTASEIAHERRQADQQREADTEQARKEAGGLADTISKNPTGILAQVQRDRQKREALKTGDKQGAGGKTEKKQQSV